LTDAEEAIDNFIELFSGRYDAFGTWTGGSIPADQYGPGFTNPLCDHLYDGPYIGVYPVTDDNMCRWGCIDIDGKDFVPTGASATSWDRMWYIACTLQETLEYKNVTSWTERTANGIHLWVFAARPVPAAVMRNALLVACQVADYKPKEVNPKQGAVTAEKPLGNYVRLPYYGALSHGMPKDRFVIDENGPMTLQQFSRMALGSRTNLSKLQAMADLYVAPALLTTTPVITDMATEEQFQMLEPILPPVVNMIFTDGPLAGDRSGAMVKTALILRDEGWQAQAIFTVLSALDNRLGKFVGRVNRDELLLGIMSKVGL